MKYKIITGISFDHPAKGPQIYRPGDEADLAGWPLEDIIKMVAEGTIEAIPPSRSKTDTNQPDKEITDGDTNKR